MEPIVRNIQTDDAYVYLGENKFRNLRTGAEGVVPEDKAKDILVFNVQATQMFNDFPLVKELLEKLHLKFDNNKTTNK